MKRALYTCIFAMIAGWAVASTVATAQSAAYQYKWPYRWDTSAVITTLPYQGVHGCQPGGECVAAYDLVIADNVVASSAQGVVTGTVANAPGCGPRLGYGNYVDVSGVRYAHLASLAPGVVTGATLLQGDQVGTQGDTGYVIPCPGGVHLHWEFRSGTVPTIDGGSSTTSNSVIGEYSTAGATLRAYYLAHGGWNSIGWTYKHCPGTCTLDMTANRSWGRMQDFQHDPDGFGGTFDTIHVANADPTRAYLVDSVFWQAWAVGGPDNYGTLRPLAMATGERGPCPAGWSAACISYQPFQLGFVWMDALTGRTAVYCPDVNGDGEVNLFDLLAVDTYYGQPAPPPPAPLVDIDGDGVIGLFDLLGVAAGYNRACRV